MDPSANLPAPSNFALSTPRTNNETQSVTATTRKHTKRVLQSTATSSAFPTALKPASSPSALPKISNFSQGFSPSSYPCLYDTVAATIRDQISHGMALRERPFVARFSPWCNPRWRMWGVDGSIRCFKRFQVQPPARVWWGRPLEVLRKTMFPSSSQHDR